MSQFFASRQFILGDFNLFMYNAFGYATSLQKNVNVAINGRTYADAFGVRANFGNNNLRELDFLGSGFTQDINGNITGGTVNVIGEFDLRDDAVHLVSRRNHVECIGALRCRPHALDR